VNRLSDIVRCSVDCNSFAEILQVLEVSNPESDVYLSFLIMEACMTQCYTTLQVLNKWGYVQSPESKECISCREEKTQECTSCRDRKKSKMFQILRVRNRFVVQEGRKSVSSGGYRDISFKIKVGFQVRVFCFVFFASESMLTCRNPQVEHRSLYQCTGNSLPAAIYTSLTLLVPQNEVGRFLRSDVRL
jgi:hypothetical protein